MVDQRRRLGFQSIELPWGKEIELAAVTIVFNISVTLFMSIFLHLILTKISIRIVVSSASAPSVIYMKVYEGSPDGWTHRVKREIVLPEGKVSVFLSQSFPIS